MLDKRPKNKGNIVPLVIIIATLWILVHGKANYKMDKLCNLSSMSHRERFLAFNCFGQKFLFMSIFKLQKQKF